MHKAGASNVAGVQMMVSRASIAWSRPGLLVSGAFVLLSPGATTVALVLACSNSARHAMASVVRSTSSLKSACANFRWCVVSANPAFLEAAAAWSASSFPFIRVVSVQFVHGLTQFQNQVVVRCIPISEGIWLILDRLKKVHYIL